MGEELDICNTSLGLGIGNGIVGRRESDDRTKNKNKRVVCLDLSFPLCLKEEEKEDDVDDLVYEHMNSKEDGSISSKTVEEGEEAKTRERGDCDNINNISNNNTNNYGSRKKLRLTKEQSTLLEDSFKLHTTLNTGQKQALATKLNLLPRQVEVWFQNRRARTKLKQTEVDCEFLKKCCERLSDENRRLKKELHDLRSRKIEQPQTSYAQFSNTTMLCPSCEKIVNPAPSSEGGSAVDAKNNMVQLHDHKIYTVNKPEGQ